MSAGDVGALRRSNLESDVALRARTALVGAVPCRYNSEVCHAPNIVTRDSFVVLPLADTHWAGALMLAIGCAAASAQNLVVNGNFDSALDTWQIQPQGVAEPSTIDIADSPTSGSALLRNDAAAAGVRVYPLRQCIQVFSPGFYFVGGYGRVPVSQTGGKLVFSYNARLSADCTTGLFSGGGDFITASTSWELVEFVVQVTSVPASFEILLGIEKTPEGGVVTGNFDEVHLVLDDLVFRDAFE